MGASGTATFGPRSGANLDAYFGLGFTRTGRTDTFQPPRDTYTEWKLELML